MTLDYLQPLQVLAPKGLNVRAKASVGSAILTMLPKDSVVTGIKGLTKQAGDYNWQAVLLGGGDQVGFCALVVEGKPTLGEIAPERPNLLPYNVRGVGASAGGWMPKPAELNLVRRNRVKTVLICAYESGQAAMAIPAFRGVGAENFIVRAASNMLGQPAQWANDTLPRVREYYDAIQPTADKPLLVALHNEPNLVKEGLGTQWMTGADFAQWFMAVASLYRSALPHVRIGFPALSPGGDIEGIRAGSDRFMASAVGALRAADWIGIHAYWLRSDGSDLTLGNLDFGGLPVIATEVGPADATTNTREAVSNAYDKLKAAKVPCIAWVLDGSGAWGNASWTANNINLEGL